MKDRIIIIIAKAAWFIRNENLHKDFQFQEIHWIKLFCPKIYIITTQNTNLYLLKFTTAVLFNKLYYVLII